MMDTNSTAFMLGAIIGAVIVGILCGLVPLSLAQKRQRQALGWIGFVLCIAAGFLLGLLGALPMAGLIALIIVLVGAPPKMKAKRDPGSVPRMRKPAPESYDL
jgi:hypothetical protein